LTANHRRRSGVGGRSLHPSSTVEACSLQASGTKPYICSAGGGENSEFCVVIALNLPPTFMEKNALFALILSFSTVFVSAQPRSVDAPEAATWQLAQINQGILVHFREKPGNPLHEVKAETMVKGDVEEAFKILSNPMNILAADPYVRNPLFLTADSASTFYYGEVHTPFFLKDRDFIIRVHTSKTATGYFMVWSGVADHLPEKPDLIRMQDLSIILSLQRVTADQYSFTYKISIGPEGSEMAINFANKALVESSFERILAFRKLVANGEHAAMEAKN
jgi:hypothetical protein